MQDLDFFVASTELPGSDSFLLAIKVFVRTQLELMEYFSELVLPALESAPEAHQSNATIFTTLQESKSNYQCMVKKLSDIPKERNPSPDPMDDPVIYSGGNFIESGFELSLRMQSNFLLSTASILHSELEYMGESQNFIKQRQESFLYYVGTFIEPVALVDQGDERTRRKPVKAQELSKASQGSKMEFSKSSLHSSLRNSLQGMIASTKQQVSQQSAATDRGAVALGPLKINDISSGATQPNPSVTPANLDNASKKEPSRHAQYLNESPVVEKKHIVVQAQTQPQPPSPLTKPKISKAAMETDMLMSHPRSRRSESISNPMSPRLQDIPLAIRRCAEYISARGLNEEGIFRESGSKVEVNAIYSMFQKGKDFDFSRTLDAHVVSGVLKIYLRDMVPPLFPYEIYKEFIGSEDITDDRERIKHYKKILEKIPKKNLFILKYLFGLLKNVSDHHQTNKMTPINLGIVFGPTLLRPNFNAVTISTSPKVVSDMIAFYEDVF